MVDPLTTGKTIVTVGKLALAVKKKLDALGPTARMLEADEVAGREWRERRAFLVEQRIPKLESTASDPAKLEELGQVMLADLQFERLQRSMEFEAAREATDERRLLLAYVAAGLSTPEFSINDKARIERAVRQLDGDDVVFLYKLATCTDLKFVYNPKDSNSEAQQRGFRDGRERLRLADERALQKVSLTTAGGVIEESKFAGGPVLTVTALGRQLLSVLDPYIQERLNA